MAGAKRQERCVWMTTNLAKWASNNGQIIKSGLPHDRREKFLPSVVGFAYNFLQYECYLGNIGYLAQALYAAEHEGQMLIPATFLAAESGPIEPNIYQLFEDGPPLRKLPDISRPVEEFLHEVWSRFGALLVKEIEGFVVRDGVWSACLKVGRNSEISVERMQAGYRGSRALGSTPQREAARHLRNPGKEYWTEEGKRAKRWILGISGRNGGAGGNGAERPTAAGVKKPVSRPDSGRNGGAGGNGNERPTAAGVKKPVSRPDAGVERTPPPQKAGEKDAAGGTAKPRRTTIMDWQQPPESKSRPRGTG